MADDKSPLTRRRVLGGMATIGAAGAVGAGTWARFTDEESKNITVEAGRLDLQFKDFRDGSWTDWQDGPIDVDLGTFKNGQKKVHCELLRNNGTVPANELTVDIPDDGISQDENGNYEPEQSAGDTDSGGDLLQFIEIAAYFVCRVSGSYHVYPCYGNASEQEISASASSVEGLVSTTEGETSVHDSLVYDQLGPVRLADAQGYDPVPVDLGNGVLAPDGEDKCLFCIVAKLDEPEGYDNANIAQSDRLTATIDVELAQDS